MMRNTANVKVNANDTNGNSSRNSHSYLQCSCRLRGYTFVEIILVVAIMGILGLSAFSFGSSFLTRNHLKNATNELVSSLRTAQINSMSGKNGGEWGVEVTSTQIKLYMSGDPVFDQTFDISKRVAVNTGNILFDHLTGNPSQALTFTVSNNIGESRIVSVNEVGIVDVN